MRASSAPAPRCRIVSSPMTDLHATSPAAASKRPTNGSSLAPASASATSPSRAYVRQNSERARAHRPRSTWHRSTSAAIDLIVVATSTPDQIFPSAACLIQARLGHLRLRRLRRAGGLQRIRLRAVGGRSHARFGQAPPRAGDRHRIFSRILDWNDRTTCVLFGDGAGAVVLEAADEPGMLASELRADGSQAGILCAAGRVSHGAMRGPPVPDDGRPGCLQARGFGAGYVGG